MEPQSGGVAVPAMSAQSFDQEPYRSPVTWQQKLGQSQNETQVVTAAREFLAQFTPDEIERLPAACQPPLKLVDADDIAAYAFDLVKHDREHMGADPMVGRLAAFFSHASLRLSQLVRRRRPAPPRGWAAESRYSL